MGWTTIQQLWQYSLWEYLAKRTCLAWWFNIQHFLPFWQSATISCGEIHPGCCLIWISTKGYCTCSFVDNACCLSENSIFRVISPLLSINHPPFLVPSPALQVEPLFNLFLSVKPLCVHKNMRLRISPIFSLDFVKILATFNFLHVWSLPSGKHTKNYGKSPFLMG